MWGILDFVYEYKEEYKYLLNVLRCEINGSTLPPKPESVSWESVYQLSRRHGISALTYYIIKKCGANLDTEIQHKWAADYSKIMVQSSNQQYELGKLVQVLSDHQIPHMILKGSLIRDLYPLPELREMSDLDFFISREYHAAVSELLTDLGYQFESDDGAHLAFVKKPHVCIEIHAELMKRADRYLDALKDPWKRAVQIKAACCYRMSDEDFYIFQLIHAAKHYYHGGTGIRSVLDIYLYLKNYRGKLDWKYIDQTISGKELRNFRKNIEGLSEYWFGDGPASDDISEMAYYILRSATYGKTELRIENTVQRYIDRGMSLAYARIACFFHMAFLPLGEMEYIYPCLKKAPVLLPACWVARWCRILVKKPQSIKKHYKEAKQVVSFKEKL